MMQKGCSSSGSVVEHLHIKFLVRQTVYTHVEGEEALTGAAGVRYSGRIGVY